MLFLIRSAFWIALVFLVVPMVTGPRRAAPPATPAGTAAAPSADALPSAAEATAGSALGALVGEVLSPAPAATTASQPAAAATAGPNVAVISDIVRFCGEHGDVCQAGFSAIDALGSAIGEGLTLIATLTSDEPAAPVAPADDGTRTVATTKILAAPAAVGTLTADDVAEPWRGTAAAVVAGSQARLRLPPPDPRKRPPQG